MSVAARHATVGGLWSPERRQLTAGLVLTITLVAFEALAISTVMPIVVDEIGGIELYGWVFSAFFLGSLLGIVVVGGLIDRGGLVRPFLAGLGLFGVGLLIGGFAPSLPILIGGRFLQGLGAGATPPIAYVAIGRSLPESLRPRMFATLSTAWVVPGLIGPAIASFVGEHLSWRAVFLGLLPLIVFAAAVTLPSLRGVPAADPVEREREHEIAEAAGRRLPNAARVAVGVGLLLAGLTWSADVGIPGGGPSVPGPVVAVALVLVGLALGVPAFRALTPPGTLVAAAGLPAAILLRGVMTCMFFAVDAFVPLAIVTARGAGTEIGGLALTGATLTWTAGSWIQARYAARAGISTFVRTSFAITVTGIALFAVTLLPFIPVVLGIAAWSVAGLGMGLGYSPLSLTVLRDAPAETQGQATSALQLSDVIGTALGSGAAGAAVSIGDRLAAPTGESLAVAFGAAVAIGLAGVVLAGRLSSRPAAAAESPTLPAEAA
ncbi:MAG TPA: MFS transporter [Candidatus Limnocylindrales bacterium]|nr:MFS transporter [Candidatus Limnocylindrales bacterium]